MRGCFGSLGSRISSLGIHSPTSGMDEVNEYGKCLPLAMPGCYEAVWFRPAGGRGEGRPVGRRACLTAQWVRRRAQAWTTRHGLRHVNAAAPEAPMLWQWRGWRRHRALRTQHWQGAQGCPGPA